MSRHHRPVHPLIEKAVEHCGGNQTELARRTGFRQQRVFKLLTLQAPITAEVAVAVHRATNGRVSGHKLRPDLWRRARDVPVPRPKPRRSRRHQIEQAAAA